MNAERYALAYEVFSKARLQEPERRGDYLDGACAGDDQLRQQVEGLLRADEDPLPLDRTLRPQLDAELPDSLPERLGQYRILSKIGEGGMGIVFEAEQERPRRCVAVKVLRPMTGPAVLRRFEREAQMLGQLRHPAIAQVYEAGVAETPHGALPFIAMERIDGYGLLEYAESRGLGVRERLELFARICDGVEHAHQHGIIHRDLKPQNILIEVQDGEVAQPKILDFGVARATEYAPAERTADQALQTGAGQLVGTIPYMSPEQVSARPGQLDVRSDVYSLGVVLFELLTGRLPYDLSECSLPAATRVIREEDPTRISSIDTTLRGDVETIVLKTLEKERDHRYASAAALAADVRRFLRDEPLRARPPSRVYQLRKFARRHRALVTGALLAFLGLASALVVVGLDLAQARAEARKHSAVREVLEGLLGAADPGPMRRSEVARAFGPGVPLRQAILDVAAHLETTPISEPDAEATVCFRVGSALFNIGQWRDSERLLTRALSLRRRLLGEQHADTLECMAALSWSKLMLGYVHEGFTLVNAAVAGLRREYGEADPVVLAAMTWQSMALGRMGQRRERLAICRRIQQVIADAGPELDVLRHWGYLVLGEALIGMGKFDEAEAALDSAGRLLRAEVGKAHFGMALCEFERAVLAMARRQYARGFELAVAARELAVESAGVQSDCSVFFDAVCWRSLFRQGRPEEGLRLLREYCGRCRERFGSGPLTLQALSDLVRMEHEHGDGDRVKELCAEWLALHDRAGNLVPADARRLLKIHAGRLAQIGLRDEVAAVEERMRRLPE